ncbi:hypothetical protein JMUB7552_27230 [Staphylococcus aureus]
MFFFKQKTAYEIAQCLVGSEMCIRDRRRWSTLLKVGKVNVLKHIDLSLIHISEPTRH